jgi:RimJ/RimL family protein N-acetyltransferase
MSFKGYGVELRPVAITDLLSLRRWRNNPNVRGKMVNKSYITPKQQRIWYEGTKKKYDQAHWVVWYKKKRAGYITIKGEGKLELQKKLSGGMYSGHSDVKHRLLGYAMQIIMLDIAFNYLSASTFKGPVQKANSNVRKLLRQLGFKESSPKGEFVWTTIKPSDFKKERKKFDRYFDDPKCELFRESTKLLKNNS